MIAACPKCHTRYRVGPEQLGSDGARLRCSQCSAVFRVRLPQAAPQSPAPLPPRQPDRLEHRPAPAERARAASEASEVNRFATAQQPTTPVASEAVRSAGVYTQAPEGRAQRGEAERSQILAPEGRAQRGEAERSQILAPEGRAQRGEAERSSSGRATAQHPDRAQHLLYDLSVRLRDLGEFGLIDRIARAAGRSARARVVLGIGDDAAVLRLRRGEDAVLTTDALVEGVHFRWRSESPAHIGFRAMVAAVSDLAAMGARPLGVTVALAAPPHLALTRVDGVVRGLLEAARRFDAPLVGGNVTRARATALTLAALGGVERGRALTRAGARPSDRIFVTGTLGDAALAVARMARGGARRHLPEPRLAAGRALTRLRGVGACIDVSDGLIADLGHLLRASGVGAEIDVSRLPRSRRFEGGCRRLGLDALRLALTGGEDYELLFTLRPGGPSSVSLRNRLGVRVSEIGRISRQPGLRGVPASIGTGWAHF